MREQQPRGAAPAPELEVRALGPATWADFAALVERHGGVWGGCWCLGFHPESAGGHRTAERNPADKEARVRAGHAHAALVYAGGTCAGWCQFGSPAELTRINHRREYERGLAAPPDWRITCFFVDREHRHRGVASVALAGALDEVSRLGGGRVESYPEDVDGRRTSGSFLHNATVALFERHGFSRVRPLGKHHWVVSRQVAPAPAAR